MNQTELIHKINDAANIIHIASLRGGSSNFIVVSSEIADIINNLDPRIKLRKERKEKLEKINKK